MWNYSFYVFTDYERTEMNYKLQTSSFLITVVLLSLVFAQVIPPLVDSGIRSDRVRGPEAAIPV